MAVAAWSEAMVPLAAFFVQRQRVARSRGHYGARRRPLQHREPTKSPVSPSYARLWKLKQSSLSSPRPNRRAPWPFSPYTHNSPASRPTAAYAVLQPRSVPQHLPAPHCWLRPCIPKLRPSFTALSPSSYVPNAPTAIATRPPQHLRIVHCCMEPRSKG